MMINDGVKIVSLTEQISLIAKETVEDFIIETIEPYCSEVAELKISKEELKKVILKNYGMPKPKHCDRNICIKNEYNGIGCDECEVVKSQEPCEEHQREFIEIVVEYPPADLCTYPEYRGKPYFSIKYRENGKEYVGFGTYKIEFLSQWIKEYFIPSIQPKTDVFDKIRTEIEQMNNIDYVEPVTVDEVLKIIDKYKAESEDKE